MYHSVNIREVTIEDLSEVMNINWAELPERYPYGFLLEIYKAEPDFFLVAEVDRKVVGYLMAVSDIDYIFGILNPIPELTSQKKSLHVLSFAVKREYQNRGIGTKLMETFIEKAKRYGKEVVYLEVRVSNFRAIKLYKKF